MLGYKYKLENLYNGETIDINSALDSEQSCLTVDGRPTGLRLTTYPTFELEVRNYEQEKTGQHGTFDFYSFYGKRNISRQPRAISFNTTQITKDFHTPKPTTTRNK